MVVVTVVVVVVIAAVVVTTVVAALMVASPAAVMHAVVVTSHVVVILCESADPAGQDEYNREKCAEFLHLPMLLPSSIGAIFVRSSWVQSM